MEHPPLLLPLATYTRQGHIFLGPAQLRAVPKPLRLAEPSPEYHLK
jgi:hypothetical protein